MEDRGFREVDVGNFVAQPGLERWPDPEAPNIPQPAPWRSNLVALSQKHNLYFAAYRDKIHVTIPRGLKQTIPGRADLIIDPPQSERAYRIGGYINTTCPHAVNHIKIGILGELEILLIACDDGDVVGYYTHVLFDEAQLPEAQIGLPGISKTTPFFHENVGTSAWGLAIHQRSRLIAVGSNNREVTVFAFGCSGWAAQMPTALQESIAARIDEVFPDISLALDSIETRIQNFKIVLPLGLGGHNIPSIDFVDDEEGLATMVLAADINGNLWNLSIWSGEKKCLPRIHKNPTQTNEMGWGVLCLPLSYFRITSSPYEALGTDVYYPTSKGDIDSLALPFHFNITETVEDVMGASMYHPLYQGRHHIANRQLSPKCPPLELGTDDSGCLGGDTFDKEVEHVISVSDQITRREIRHESNITLQKHLQDAISPYEPSYQEDLNSRDGVAREAGYFATRCEQLGIFRATSLSDGRKSRTDYKYRTFLPAGQAIFHTYNHDFHLCSPCPLALPSTVGQKILKQRLPRPVPPQLSNYDRLNLLAVIPELGLVVVGSQVGRVALLTLTRLEEGFSRFGDVVMCRLDKILPFSQDEEKNRPLIQLLGMAVGPLQTNDGEEGDARVKGSKRWRIFLHYFDGTILSYEIWREGEGDLVVF